MKNLNGGYIFIAFSNSTHFSEDLGCLGFSSFIRHHKEKTILKIKNVTVFGTKSDNLLAPERTLLAIQKIDILAPEILPQILASEFCYTLYNDSLE